MRNKAVLLFALLLFLSAGSSAGAERKAADFNLSNWDGAKTSLEGFKGRVVVLTFSYSNCSVRCPIITGRLLSLDYALGSPRDIAYLHISVDPKSDTHERRKKYFSLYGINAEKDRRWQFISGESKELSIIWKAYGVTSKKVKDRRLPEGYYVDFVQKMAVIDTSGIIRYEGMADFSEDEAARVINSLIGKPSIRFSETSFDFGIVKEGDVVSHDFEFMNEGRGTLVIKDIIPA